MGGLKALNGARADGLQVVQESAEMGRMARAPHYHLDNPTKLPISDHSMGYITYRWARSEGSRDTIRRHHNFAV